MNEGPKNIYAVSLQWNYLPNHKQGVLMFQQNCYSVILKNLC